MSGAHLTLESRLAALIEGESGVDLAVRLEQAAASVPTALEARRVRFRHLFDELKETP